MRWLIVILYCLTYCGDWDSGTESAVRVSYPLRLVPSVYVQCDKTILGIA